MEEEPNLVKDYLFDYIQKSETTIKELISKEKFDEIIEDILKNCYDKISSMGNKDESLGVLATGILHYLLTNALISSQRKVSYQNTEIDIIIPDVKTLENDPKKTLIICIPKSSDTESIQNKLNELNKIQPEKQNIWLVLSEDTNIENKSYTITKENSSFTKIIYDIAGFANVNVSNKFKILRV